MTAKPRRARMRRPEEALQRQFVAYLRAALPKPWLVWHTPNGGGLSRAKPRLNPHQRALQADLWACGVPVLVVDDLAKAFVALRALGVPLGGRAQ